MAGHVAHAEITVAATPERVWRALTDPALIKEWMVGTEVETDWGVGSPITWHGELGGKTYRDRGKILVYEEPRKLSMTHYSPLMGLPDEPDSYHTVTYDIESLDQRTTVTLTQDGNDTPEQAEQFSANWQSMLDALASTVEHR